MYETQYIKNKYLVMELNNMRREAATPVLYKQRTLYIICFYQVSRDNEEKES